MSLPNRRTSRFIRSTTVALLVAISLAGIRVSGQEPKEPASKRALSVADAIQTARVMSAPPTAGGSTAILAKSIGQDVFISPDGKRYVVLLVRSDLQRNGNWIEILSGSLTSFASARRPEVIGRLLMSSLGTQFGYGTTILTFNPSTNHIAWVDNERLTFLWGDKQNVGQIFEANLRTHEVEQLTHHSTNVTMYGISPTAGIIYSAAAQHSRKHSEELVQSGFTVTNVELFSALAGDADGYGLYDWNANSELFLLATQKSNPRRIALNGETVNSLAPSAMKFSPDGRFALVNGVATVIPESWDKYTEQITAMHIRELRRNGPKAPTARLTRQLFVVDAATGKSHALWDAPESPFDFDSANWSPDGRSILIGPTFLPPTEADPAGLNGAAVAVVDAGTGRFSDLPIPSNFTADAIEELGWVSPDVVRLKDASTELRFKKANGQWELSADPIPVEEKPSVTVRIEVRQDLNHPPLLFAVDTATKREQMIFDPNPGLRKFKLGRVEHVTWDDSAGRSWSGLLYYPVNYSADRRFPLVIQTHGHAPETEFSLSGRTLGVGPTGPVFAAQALANRGFAVLQVQDKRIPGVSVTSAEPAANMDAYERAIAHFADSGLVDPKKVGLAGYSRTGWYVEYSLTHSSFPFAAAVVCGPTDPSYIWTAALSWTQEMSADAGAEPFGDGLNTWLKNSPGFNADKVHTPLQFQSDGGGFPSIMMYWEMFSRLRHLNKPVELYMVPDVEHGSHAMQNPRQLVASQQRALDWFEFWLNGREDPDPAKAGQYASWRELRKQKENEK